MRGVICQKPSDLAEKLTCEPETDIRHCAASPELWAQSRHLLRDARGSANGVHGRAGGYLCPEHAKAHTLIALTRMK